MAAAAAIVGGVFQVTGAQNQARAQKAQGEYQKSMYDENAAFSTLAAEDAIRRGDKDAAQLKNQGKQTIGAQRAALAAQGVDVGSGSALDIQVDTAYQVQLDSMKIKNNAWREAWGYKTEALNASTAGRFAQLGAKVSANNTLATGGLQAINTIGTVAYQSRGQGANQSSAQTTKLGSK